MRELLKPTNKSFTPRELVKTDFYCDFPRPHFLVARV